MRDVIVIGAGSAGCAVAGRLTEAGLKVLLLEAGGPGDWDNIKVPALMDTLMDSPVDWGYRTVPQAGLLGRKIFMVRGKCLGGSSALNFMVYMRGNRGDYDHWRDLGNAGWGYDDVLPLFRRSEANERFQDAYHGSTGPLVVAEQKHLSPLTHRYLEACAEVGIPRNDDFNGATQEGYGLIQATIGQRGRCSAKVAFLDPVIGRANLTVETGAHVTRILVENGRAVGVSYIRNGIVETARAERDRPLGRRHQLAAAV